jgi:redox-sensitive bicupin YhaK (pirin superfamily)
MALRLVNSEIGDRPSPAGQDLFIRRASERGISERPWLKSFHTFSFGEYYDLKFMGFRKLRVLNEDLIAPTEGFPFHTQKNMELLTYVIDGGLAHKDNFKDNFEDEAIINLIRPGEIQRISAGTGIRHSEMNASEHLPLHFLQIWIEPETLDLPPSYEQGRFRREERIGKVKLIVSPEGREGSVRINQDASIYTSLLGVEDPISFWLNRDRYGWLQVVRGEIELNGASLKTGDGVAIFGGGPLELHASGSSRLDPSEIILFDLA